MRYATVCSGIEAPGMAWDALGWGQVFASEIEAFPSAVLAHHKPEVPNYGDMTKYKEWPDHDDIGLICGGTPCQSFSVAGLRKGLDDPRGNLALTFIGLVDRYRPRWVVWENVPGVLSSGGGEDFGSFIDGMAEIGYFGAWRVLDAQWFGVAQRRRRVFAIFCPGDWRPAAAVLFEPESLRGDSAPSREAGKGVAAGPAHSLRGRGFDASEDGTGRGTPIVPEIAKAIRTPTGGIDREDMHTIIPDVVGTLSDGAHNGGGLNGQDAYSGRILPVITGAITARLGGAAMGAPEVDANMYIPVQDEGQTPIVTKDDVSKTLDSSSGLNPTAAQGGTCVFSATPMVNMQGSKSNAVAQEDGPSFTLNAMHGHDVHAVLPPSMAVRRLTPVECERLQGFPDNHTRIPWRNKPAEDCPDGPRYKALGNSMAVPVVRWIGERIQQYEDKK